MRWVGILVTVPLLQKDTMVKAGAAVLSVYRRISMLKGSGLREAGGEGLGWKG